MNFKTLDDLEDISGKRGLVRVDINEPLNGGQGSDVTRIRRIPATINVLSD